MPSLLKIERDRLLAEANSLREIVDRMEDEDVMARLSLESRLVEVEKEIAEIGPQLEGRATVALFFGGRPVIGQRGIQSDFASVALGKFQDLVSKMLANQSNDLGQRGPVAERDASIMHITNVVRGSFGFLLEEMSEQGQLFDTRLEKAVEDAGRLLIAFSDENEESFNLAVDETDKRVLSAAKGVMEHLHLSDATLRLLTTEIDYSFRAESLELAAQRALITELLEEVVELSGTIVGLLPEGHMFEFRDDEGAVLRGRVSRDISSDQIMEWNNGILNQPLRCSFIKKTVFNDGAISRQRYTLLGVL